MSLRRTPVIQVRGNAATPYLSPRPRRVPPAEQSEIPILSAINAVSDPFAIADQSSRIVLQNAPWATLVNARNASDADDDHAFLRHFGVVDGSLPNLSTTAKNLRELFSGERQSLSVRHKITDGCSELWLQMSAAGIQDLPGHVAIIHRNISDLRQAQCDISRLSTALLEATDAERQRIARMIHDTTAQHLVASKLYLEKALSDIVKSGNVSECGVKALEHLERSLREIRAFSYLLYPPDLGDAGLAKLVRSFLNGFVERTGIQVACDVAVGLPPMSPDAKQGVLLIVQEALTNVYRHSGSGAAVVTMRPDDDKLVLEVADYGRQCPAVPMKEKLSTRPGVGISSMRARAVRYGGSLSIQSNKHGTILRAVFPAAGLTRAPNTALP
jgi:two-component system NarL family sensor kinase